MGIIMGIILSEEVDRGGRSMRAEVGDTTRRSEVTSGESKQMVGRGRIFSGVLILE